MLHPPYVCSLAAAVPLGKRDLLVENILIVVIRRLFLRPFLRLARLRLARAGFTSGSALGFSLGFFASGLVSSGGGMTSSSGNAGSGLVCAGGFAGALSFSGRSTAGTSTAGFSAAFSGVRGRLQQPSFPPGPPRQVWPFQPCGGDANAPAAKRLGECDIQGLHHLADARFEVVRLAENLSPGLTTVRSPKSRAISASAASSTVILGLKKRFWTLTISRPLRELATCAQRHSWRLRARICWVLSPRLFAPPWALAAVGCLVGNPEVRRRLGGGRPRVSSLCRARTIGIVLGLGMVACEFHAQGPFRQCPAWA